MSSYLNHETREVTVKDPFRKTFSVMIVVLACVFALIFAGCEGSDAKKTIADTVNKAMGGDAVRKGEEMKKNLDQAMNQEAKRLLKMDKDAKGDTAGEGKGSQGEKESDK
jgi:hypothetical protein